MSRTYRRKNGWDTPTRDYVFNEELGHWQDIALDKNSLEFKKQTNKYHSDHNLYGGSVPHWFVNLFFERKFRRKTKKEIHKWLKNPTNIEIMIPEFIRDSGWYFW